MKEPKENKKQSIAWMVSIGVHGLLLLAFIFMIAWREPNPPHPEFGIEVNFGLEEVGSGDTQPTVPVNESESTEEAQPEELVTEEEVIAEEETIEEVVESQPTETAKVTEVIQQPTESPDVVEEVDQPKEEVKPIEEKKEEVKETPKEVKKPVLYQKKEGADGKDGESTTPQNANHGDKANEVGDMGDKEGTLDARTLYGNKGGGGGGPALEITGWLWDGIPNKKDPSSENGMIVFKFTIDDNGEVLSVIPEQYNVGPAVMNFYKQQLLKTTFSQTDPNVSPLPRTTGKVTFVIKSK